MPNRCSITVNSTKASLAFVPLSHPLFSSTKPPFHLFHRTTLRFVSESTLSSALQSRSSVCFTHHPIRLFHKATLSFVGWVTPFLQRASFVCLTATFLFISSQTYLFVCCTNIFRYCTDQRICLHLRFTLLSVSQRNLSLPKIQSRFHCCQPFVAKMTWVTYSLSLIWYFELKPAFTKESRIET